MSRSLVKQMFIVQTEEDKRVIDSNERVESRLKELAKKNQEAGGGNGGFVAGLNAEHITVLPEGEEAEGVPPEPVLKAEQAKEEARQILEQAAADAQAKIADAQVEAENIKKEAHEKTEKERVQILEEAKRRGYEEGLAKAKSEAEVLRREYAQKERELEERYQQQIDELEPQFVDAITDIYEHILGVDLGNQREILAHLISGTIRKIEGAHSFIIHVSKEDYPFVSMQKKQLMAGAAAGNSTVEVVEDLVMKKNECTIETDGGIFDCGLGTQLSELKKRLMLLSYSKEA